MHSMYSAGYLDGLQTGQCLGLDGVTQYFQILDRSISIHVCHKNSLHFSSALTFKMPAIWTAEGQICLVMHHSQTEKAS